MAHSVPDLYEPWLLCEYSSGTMFKNSMTPIISYSAFRDLGFMKPGDIDL